MTELNDALETMGCISNVFMFSVNTCVGGHSTPILSLEDERSEMI